MSTFKDNSGAYFSLYRNRRYVLWRIWDRTKPMIMFIGLNPSDANELQNDPTVRRVIDFSRKWGYGGVYMLNLYPMVSSNPKNVNFDKITKLAMAKNDAYLNFIGRKCKDIIFAWGAHKGIEERAKVVIDMFPQGKALWINKDGSPKHPLYIHSSVIPIKFKNHED